MVVYGQLAWSTDPVNLRLMDYTADFRDFDLTPDGSLSWACASPAPMDCSSGR